MLLINTRDPASTEQATETASRQQRVNWRQRFGADAIAPLRQHTIASPDHTIVQRGHQVARHAQLLKSVPFLEISYAKNYANLPQVADEVMHRVAQL